ncbi:aldo/keto reductase [uncultured Pseudokineococcus sp.]|uniref:aldo/keto reductase n=1 Tax=uncultured Pseudokineococcus sp. TaxID=1642928 RepID=UPI00262BF121|nr:aldo/keto reductase [uncultured Pseudokineococcus sp.]
MRTRPVGRTGLRTTVLGFGAAALGNLYAAVSDEQAAAAVDAAWDRGVRTFDVAPHYGLGLAERRLGAALVGRPRAEHLLSSKVGRVLEPVEDPGDARDLDNGFDVPADHRRRRDYSRDGVLRSVEDTLVRLGADRLDVLLVHDPDDFEREAVEGALPALLELREQGVVRAVGAGMNQSAMLTRFVERFDLDVVLCAGRCTLLEQPAADDLLPAAARAGTSVLLGGVFASGLLARDWPADDATYEYAPAPAPVLERARRTASACTEHGVPLPAAALQFALAQQGVCGALLGMRSPQEVHADADLLDVDVPADLWGDLRARGLLREDVAVPAPSGAGSR